MHPSGAITTELPRTRATLLLLLLLLLRRLLGSGRRLREVLANLAALAAWYAHLLALPASVGQDALKRLVDEAAPLREDLLVAAEALAHKGIVDAPRVAEIRRGQGHLDTANDLVALAALFSEGWDAVKNRTTVEWKDVERASQLGPELLVALGARQQPGLPTPKAGDAAERRARAFTLLVNAYDACRRAVSYLRWKEGDADAIAPSLFARGGGRKPGAGKNNAGGGDDDGASTEPGAPGGEPLLEPTVE
ncbi:hypothetical protein WMF28_06490 [Sorangium sp. So ce590]|uniref:hypothetical protein n=1 Tax=Sorangium sp. So ce590 TaxID=3133317 RepID=UPI003F5ED622